MCTSRASMTRATTPSAVQAPGGSSPSVPAHGAHSAPSVSVAGAAFFFFVCFGADAPFFFAEPAGFLVGAGDGLRGAALVRLAVGFAFLPEANWGLAA